MILKTHILWYKKESEVKLKGQEIGLLSETKQEFRIVHEKYL